MIMIRPVSDLNNEISEFEALVMNENQTVILIKHYKEHMVIMSHGAYNKLTGKIDTLENQLAETEMQFNEAESKLAVYGGILKSEGQISRGEGLPWKATKKQSDARHKGRHDTEVNRDPC